MNIDFSKYSGCGNDFILIDNRNLVFDHTQKEKIIHLCRRSLGIGADGIVLLESSENGDFRMRIFNADGSEAEMCGNGLRCLVRFIKELNIEGSKFTIETMHQLIPVEISGDLVSASMPSPTKCCFSNELALDGVLYNFHFLDTGVPHAVIFTENLKDDTLMNIAPKIRHHPHFSPTGTNVNFATLETNGEINVRTYERGVEGETLACGTGAAAVAIAAAETYKLCSPISIRPKSGDTIHISFSMDESFPNNPLIMSGPAIKVFSGSFSF